MKARRKGTNEVFKEIKSVIYKSGFVADIKDLEFEQSSSDHWQEKDNTMAFTLMRDIEQINFISKEGKGERISWLNSLEDRFNNQESDKDHWQDLRERAAIAVIQAFCAAPVTKDIESITIDDATKFAVEIADALIEKMKGE